MLLDKSLKANPNLVLFIYRLWKIQPQSAEWKEEEDNRAIEIVIDLVILWSMIENTPDFFGCVLHWITSSIRITIISSVLRFLFFNFFCANRIFCATEFIFSPEINDTTPPIFLLSNTPGVLEKKSIAEILKHRSPRWIWFYLF